MSETPSRRSVLGWSLLVGAAAATLPALRDAVASPTAPPQFTGPQPNPFWNAVGPFAAFPQKLPLLRLSDRPVVLETPRALLGSAITPNAAFYVRWHLPNLPQSVDLATWRLAIDGAVSQSLRLSYADLLAEPAESIIAVSQCAGNSRSRFEPRVAGAQWGNGGMGCAKWTGVSLKKLLDKAGIGPKGVCVRFEGSETGNGPEGYGSHAFAKAINLDDPVLDRAIVAYAMNDEPLPFLHGFPVRIVVPGWFATYWVKALGTIRVLDTPDENFWTKSAYKAPVGGTTTPEAAATAEMKSLSVMPVRSFLIGPDDDTPLVDGLPARLYGVAFSGTGPVVRVDVSLDDGATWKEATLGEDRGPYAWRTWELFHTPGPHPLAVRVRATDAAGNVQPDAAVWNPGGYLFNTIERTVLNAGGAS